LILDIHAHAGIGDGLSGPWDTRAPLRDYLARAGRAGIDRTVIFPPFHSDSRTANRRIAQLVRTRPHRLIGFAAVHARIDRGRVDDLLREAVGALRLRGLKVHRHQSRITREVCEAARRWRLPVLYDVAGESAVIELLAREYPDVTFIIPHLGSFADSWAAQLAVIDHASRHPRVFVDTSGVRRFDLLVEAVRRAGPSKILFGSDGPWLHPGVELAKIRALRLRPADERLIVGENAVRILSEHDAARSRLSSSPWGSRWSGRRQGRPAPRVSHRREARSARRGPTSFSRATARTPPR
jgi:uncharacterized protein